MFRRHSLLRDWQINVREVLLLSTDHTLLNITDEGQTNPNGDDYEYLTIQRVIE